MAKKQLALIRQRLNVTTAIGEVTLLENAGHQGIRGIEMEMVKEGMHQWIHLLQMPWLFKMGYVVMIGAFRLKKASQTLL
ncbi:hypothetical protein Tco_1056118 [Tanacetum coccineum]|uniref:Uncharacterized protein n=1 Tax=Tanacetum coccineum TaxID=301880 RepID=A0ABQ5H2R1_9ASTR